MAEINLAGIFTGAKWYVPITAAVVGIFYMFQNPISHWINPADEVGLVEEAAALTDDDILSVGYWKLNDEKTLWECAGSHSLYHYDFCMQTGSFANDNFVKQFQIRLETQDTIVVPIIPSNDPNSSFRRYWVGTYSSIYGLDESTWGEEFYVIYFQVGDTNNLRRVLYTRDKNDAKEGRAFTTHFEHMIEDKFN